MRRPTLLFSDSKGRISSVPGLEAAGMKAGVHFRLKPRDLIRLPPGSRLFRLPARSPVGYDTASNRFVTLEGGCAVAAFTPPGFTATYSSSYSERRRTKMLPLFSYAAVALYTEGLYVAAVRVDRSLCHDQTRMDIADVKKGIKRLGALSLRNRLITHLERCAIEYGCPNAQNFFLGRYEAPLPSARLCNARCAGCISHQPPSGCPATQPRIRFTPSPEELAEVALAHFARVPDPVASFGQGCEGEPLLAGPVIEKAVAIIRKKTAKGVLNMNTNGSSPAMIAKLFDAGLDTIRVSTNTVREPYYARYYRPKGYSFKDVIRSIRAAKRRRGFVSINYLSIPGFTDTAEEFRALKNFVEKERIDMIQWRNLNFDPMEYFRIIKFRPSASDMLGMREVMRMLKRKFPRLVTGYFNPGRKKICPS